MITCDEVVARFLSGDLDLTTAAGQYVEAARLGAHTTSQRHFVFRQAVRRRVESMLAGDRPGHRVVADAAGRVQWRQ